MYDPSVHVFCECVSRNNWRWIHVLTHTHTHQKHPKTMSIKFPIISINFQQRSSAIRDGPLYTMRRSWTQRRWNSCWSNTSVRSYMMGGWLNNRRWRGIRFVVVVQVDVCFGRKSHMIFEFLYMFVFGIYWILIWWMSCTREKQI